MANIYHIGYGVPDLAEGMTQLGAALRVSWRPVLHSLLDVTDEFGERRSIEMHRTFSVGGPIAVEIFQAVPGTPFALGATPVHHVGMWVTDFAVETQRLDDSGWRRIGTTVDEAGVPTRYALHRAPDGFVLELADVTVDRPWIRDLFPA